MVCIEHAKAEDMLVAGVAVIDVRGESTRPVPVEVETRRVLPVIEALKKLPQRLDISRYQLGASDAEKPSYRNVVSDVLQFLHECALACQEAGIARDRLIFDPGFRFSKTQQDRTIIVARQSRGVSAANVTYIG